METSLSWSSLCRRKPNGKGKLITSPAVSSWNGQASASPSDRRGGFDRPCRGGGGLVSATGRVDCHTTRADRLRAWRIRELHARVDSRRKSARHGLGLHWPTLWQCLLCRCGRGWEDVLSTGRWNRLLSSDYGKIPAAR